MWFANLARAYQYDGGLQGGTDLFTDAQEDFSGMPDVVLLFQWTEEDKDILVDGGDS